MHRHSTNLFKDEVSISLKQLRLSFLEIQKLGGDLTPDAVEKIIKDMDLLIEYSELQFQEFHQAQQFIASLRPVNDGGRTIN